MSARAHVQFSLDDLKTPESLERVLRQFQSALGSTSSTPAQLPSTSHLVAQLAPLIRDQLQAPGGTPLNLQSLLPSQGNSVLLEDTHANRLTLYPASSYAVGTVFYETDRTVVYAVTSSSGTLVWTYITGMYSAVIANKPADLGVNDAGFLFWVTLQNHIFRWSGTAWAFTDDEGGVIYDRVSAPTSSGWQLCDGTATDYLQISAGNIVVTAFTTPDENTAPSGVYHKSIAAYTGTINAAVAPVFSGTPATLTGNVAAPTFSGTPNTLTGTISAIAATATVTQTTTPGVGQNTADQVHTHPAPTLTMNSYTPAGTNSAPTLTMNSYTPAGTLSTISEPRNLGVIRYFRR